MRFYSTDTVCGITGVLACTLRNWKRAGLISSPQYPDGYSLNQLTRIRIVLALTAGGSTLREIYALLKGNAALHHSSWVCRQEELYKQLHDPSDAALYARVRQMGNDYSGDDFVNAYLRPLNLWLRTDISPGASLRLARFHATVVSHAQCIMRSAARRQSVPLFLEAVSVTDPTEIWMEAIRLTGQGCRVELSSEVTGIPASPSRRYEHHLMWCGAGLSPLMRWNYRERLRDNQRVMLCGPDQTLLPTT